VRWAQSPCPGRGAEHDPRLLAVLVALDDLLGSAVAEELNLQTASADRKETVTTLAEAEGLKGHAESVRRRLEPRA